MCSKCRLWLICRNAHRLSNLHNDYDIIINICAKCTASIQCNYQIDVTSQWWWWDDNRQQRRQYANTSSCWYDVTSPFTCFDLRITLVAFDISTIDLWWFGRSSHVAKDVHEAVLLNNTCRVYRNSTNINIIGFNVPPIHGTGTIMFHFGIVIVKA